MTSIIRIALLTAVCGLILAPMTALAQVEWLNPEGRQGLSFEFTAGSFETDDYFDLSREIPFPTSSIFVTLRGRFSPLVSGVCELPYFISKREWTYGYTEPEPYKETRSGIANPYFGIEFGKEGTSPLWNLGVRLPTISEENMAWASSSWYISSHRFMAYAHKVLQVSSNWGYRYVDPTGFGLRGALGGQVGIPDEGDAELYLDIATNFWYRTGKVRLMSGFSTLYWLTESNVDFGDRHLTSVSFAADVTFGQIEPGMHFQLPIGSNLTETINFMYGVHLTYYFPVTASKP